MFHNLRMILKRFQSIFVAIFKMLKRAFATFWVCRKNHRFHEILHGQERVEKTRKSWTFATHQTTNIMYHTQNHAQVVNVMEWNNFSMRSKSISLNMRCRDLYKEWKWGQKVQNWQTEQNFATHSTVVFKTHVSFSLRTEIYSFRPSWWSFDLHHPALCKQQTRFHVLIVDTACRCSSWLWSYRSWGSATRWYGATGDENQGQYRNGLIQVIHSSSHPPGLLGNIHNNCLRLLSLYNVSH